MDNTEDFFKNYRGKYSQYWIERWGLIPELPTSFDNANSIYELVAWLQRAFKNLLDDFQQLEAESEDFKNAIIDLLEYLIPELIRRYHDSAEFRALFIILLEDILAGEERTWVKDLLKELLEVDMRDWIEDYLKTLYGLQLNEINAKLADTSKKYSAVYPSNGLQGLILDGVSDNTTILQNIINYVGSVGGGTILLPNITIRCNIRIDQNNIRLEGSIGSVTGLNGGGTILTPFNNLQDCVTVGSESVNLRNISIANLSIVGSRTDGGENGLVIKGVYNATFSNINVTHFNKNCIWITSGAKPTSFINFINTHIAFSNENLIKMEYGQTWLTGVYWTNVNGIADNGKCIHLDNANFKAVNGYFDYGVNGALKLLNGSKVMGTNLEFDSSSVSYAINDVEIDKLSTSYWEFREGHIMFNPDSQIKFSDGTVKPMSVFNGNDMKSFMFSPLLYSPVVYNRINFWDNTLKNIISNGTFLEINNNIGDINVTSETTRFRKATSGTFNNVRIINESGGVEIANNNGAIDLTPVSGKSVNVKGGFTATGMINAPGGLYAEGKWDNGVIQLGGHRLWVDSTGKLRIKNSAPTSDTDGTIVGSQT